MFDRASNPIQFKTLLSFNQFYFN